MHESQVSPWHPGRAVTENASILTTVF